MNPTSKERYQRFISLCKQGLSNKEIADAMGLEKRTITKKKATARSRGDLPPAYRNGYHYAMNRRRRYGTMSPGNIRDLLGPMDKALVEWLMSQTPDGASITDTIRSIVTDAYMDETGG